MFDLFEEEQSAADRAIAAQERARVTASTFTPDRVEKLGRIARDNPTLRPDASLSLTAMADGERLAPQVALAQDQMGVQPQLGEWLSPTSARLVAEASPEQLATMQSLLDPTLNTAASRIRGPGNVLQRAAGALGGALGGPASWLGGGLDRIPGSDQVYEGLKYGVRTAMPLLDAGQQYMQARGRRAVAAGMDVADGHFMQALGNVASAVDLSATGNARFGLQDAGQLDLYQQLAQGVRDPMSVLPGGGNGDLGNGFFYNEDSDLVRLRKEAERSMGTLPSSVRQSAVNAVGRENGLEVLPDGQTITIGRGLAHFAGFDPDSTAYNVLSGIADGVVALGAPGPERWAATQTVGRARAPLSRALGGVSEREFRQSIGLFTGTMTQVDYRRATEAIYSGKVDNLVDFVADSNGEGAWAAIRRATGGSLGNETISALADTSDPQLIRDLLMQAVLRHELPTMSVRGAGRLSAGARMGAAMAGSDFRWSGRIRRLGGQVPPGRIDFRDEAQSVDAVMEFGRNTNINTSTIDGWAEKMGRASNVVDRRNAYAEIMTDAANRLTKGGLDEDQARAMTKYMRNELETTRAARDAMLDAGVTEWSEGLIDGKAPSASAIAEMAETLPLPDAREIRRATGWMRPLWEMGKDPKNDALFARILGPSWRHSVNALSFVQGRFWKDMRLIRMGYPLRVIPEEFLRRIADGQTVITHPLSMFGAMTDARVGSVDPDELISGWRRLLPGGRQSGIRDLSGNVMLPEQQLSRAARAMPGFSDLEADDFAQAALADSRAISLRDAGRSSSSGPWVRVHRDTDWGTINQDFLTGWDDTLRRLASDPIHQRLARVGVDDTLDELLSARPVAGPRLADDSVSSFDDLTQQTRDGGFAGELLDKLDSMGFSDEPDLRRYLESQMRRLEAMTGNNADLLAAIGSGRKADGATLRRMADEGFAPEAINMRGVVNKDAVAAYDDATAAIFDFLASRPTNRLSRSPVFLEQYERNLIDLAPAAAKPDELIAAARRANVRRSTLDEITRLAQGNGALQITHIDTLAKKGALNHVEGLLYDMGQRSQFFDQYRLLFPFGEAWKEVVTTWAKLVSQDPFTVIRRGGQAGRALASSDTGQTYRDMAGLDGHFDEGFFYENEFGDLVFYYPGSEEFTRFMTSRNSVPVLNRVGVNIPNPLSSRTGDNVFDVFDQSSGVPFGLEGGMASLNIAGQPTPGLGPIAGMLAYEFLPNDTAWDSLRADLFPYGRPNELKDMGTWLPSWVNTAFLKGDPLTPEQQRLYGNTQWRVARYLYSQDPAKYQGDGGRQQLIEDSRGPTSVLFFTRGMVQAAAPASPMLASRIVGPDGELINQAVVTEQYYKFMDEDPRTALERTLELFGSGALMVAQGNTISTVYGGTPLSGEGYGWLRDNDGVDKRHPDLYGFFAPAGDPEDFVSEAYARTLDTGERVQLTTDEKIKLAEHRIASSIFRHYSEMAGDNPSDEQKMILDAIREDLRRQFPGYQQVSSIGGRDPVWRIIEGGAVEKALNDPVTAETEAGQGLAAYWAVRAQVVAAAEANGLDTVSSGGWRRAKAGAQYRELLRLVGDDIASQNPAFVPIWDEFLSQEFLAFEDEATDG